MEVKVSRERGDTRVFWVSVLQGTSLFMCCSMHILFQPCPHLFCCTGALTGFAHHSCSILVFPLYNKIIFAVATGRSKYTSALGFGKCCWCWLEMLLYWKQHCFVLTAEELQVQVVWDLSRLLEQSLIPQQWCICFESPLAEELEGKSSVPNVPGSSPKGVVNFPLAVLSRKEQTLQDRQLSIKEQEWELLPRLARKVPTWSIPWGCGSPQEPGGRAGMRGHVLERCYCSPSTEGPLLGSIFCLSNTCWPARLDSCVPSASCEPSPSRHPPGSCSGSLLSGSLSHPRSIVAGSSMPCLFVFITKNLCTAAEFDFQTSVCSSCLFPAGA